MRLTPHANYHLTLRFLGDINRDDAGAILDAVAALEGACLRCRVVGLGGFPRRERAYVVFAELERSAALDRWAAALSEVFPGGDKNFIPHVTVARSRTRVVVPRLENVQGLTLDLSAPMLYESVSVPGGARYRAVTTGSPAGD